MDVLRDTGCSGIVVRDCTIIIRRGEGLKPEGGP